MTYHPVTFSNEGTNIHKTIHAYKYPETTSETTVCGLRVPDVMDGFAIKNEDIDCEACYATDEH